MLTIIMKTTETVKDSLGMQFSEIQRHWRGTMDKRLRPLGLSQAKWRAMLHILRSGGGIRQTDLASHIGIETPTLVRLLDRLENDGWVRRCGLPEDRRVKVVKLTKKGTSAMKVITKVAKRTRDEIFSGISSNELALLVKILCKVRKRAQVLHEA